MTRYERSVNRNLHRATLALDRRYGERNGLRHEDVFEHYMEKYRRHVKREQAASDLSFRLDRIPDARR